MSPEETDFERGQRVEREKQLRKDVDLLINRMDGVERSNVDLAKKFGEFTTQARTAAEAAKQAADNAVSTKMFFVGVGGIIVTAIGLALGHSI
jgi:hypothetical protein